VSAFAQVPDPRRRQGRRHPLAAVLALAIAQWAGEQDASGRVALGLPAGKASHQSTLQRLFAKLDPDRLVAALGPAVGGLVPAPGARAAQGVSVDRKAQRGRLAADPAAGVVHALSAFCPGLGIVLAQALIEHAADKAEAELTVAPEVIAAVDWPHRVLTGDAKFCQRTVCRDMLERGGDYLLLVKANQPASSRTSASSSNRRIRR
jgi:hypothetical protein